MFKISFEKSHKKISQYKSLLFYQHYLTFENEILNVLLVSQLMRSCGKNASNYSRGSKLSIENKLKIKH